MSALAKDPEHRYQSADDLRADLLRFRRGRPLAAAPVTAIVAEIPTAAAAAAGAGVAAAATVAATRGRRPTPTPGRRPTNRAGAEHPRHRSRCSCSVLVAVVGRIILFASLKLGGNQTTVTVPDVREPADRAGDRGAQGQAPRPGHQDRRSAPTARRHGHRPGSRSPAPRSKKGSEVTITRERRRRSRSTSPTSTTRSFDRREQALTSRRLPGAGRPAKRARPSTRISSSAPNPPVGTPADKSARPCNHHSVARSVTRPRRRWTCRRTTASRSSAKPGSGPHGDRAERAARSTATSRAPTRPARQRSPRAATVRMFVSTGARRCRCRTWSG